MRGVVWAVFWRKTPRCILHYRGWSPKLALWLKTPRCILHERLLCSSPKSAGISVLPCRLGYSHRGDGIRGKGDGNAQAVAGSVVLRRIPAQMGEGGSHVGRLHGRVAGKRGRQRVACMWGRLHVRVAHVGVAHVGASLGRGLGLICKFKTMQFYSFSSSVSFITSRTWLGMMGTRHGGRRLSSERINTKQTIL